MRRSPYPRNRKSSNYGLRRCSDSRSVFLINSPARAAHGHVGSQATCVPVHASARYWSMPSVCIYTTLHIRMSKVILQFLPDPFEQHMQHMLCLQRIAIAWFEIASSIFCMCLLVHIHLFSMSLHWVSSPYFLVATYSPMK